MGKGSKKFSTCVVTILIISIGMTLFLFRTNVQAAIFGTKYYYLALEKDNLDQLKKDFKDNRIQALTSALKLNAELDGDFIDSDKETKTIADYLSKFELLVNYSANNKSFRDVYYTSLLSAKYDGKKLADVDIKSADDKTLIAFPGLTDKTVGIETSKMASRLNLAFQGDENAFKESFGVTRQQYNKLVERYLKDIIVKQIPDEKVVFNNDAEFQNMACNSITFNIDQKVISDIYKALAKEVVNDKELKTIITSITYSFLDVLNENTALINKPSLEEIDNTIKDFCGELNNEAENMEDVQFSYTAYFKDNGDILSRQFKDELGDAQAKLSTYKNLSGVDIFEFNLNENEKNIFELIGSKLENGNTYTGSFNIDITGKSLLKSNYTYQKDAKAGNIDAFVGEINGKLNIEQFSDYLNNYEDNDVSDIYFNFVNKKKDIDTLAGETKITSKINGKSVGLRIFTELKQSDVTIPRPQVSLENSIKLTDYLRLNELGTEISESLQKKILEIIPIFGALEDENIQ
ncbi:MAG: hypothetical protein ACYDG2_18205 [Ruminiclostridium sp.]